MFTGLYTAIVTPFTSDGSIDKIAYKNHLKYQIDHGVDGLVVCGTTGESPTFSNEEFEYLVAEAVSAAAGKCKVIAGSGSNSTHKSVTRSHIAKKTGVDGLLIVSPYYNKPTQRGLKNHYLAIADEVTLPVMVYNVPGRTAINIEPKTVAELAQHPNIACIKEASGNMQQIMEVINRVPDDFPVLSGDDAMTLPLIATGGRGVVSVAANEAPALMKQYLNACLNNIQSARKLHYKLLPLMQANFWESNPIPVKAALAMMGRMGNNLRPPLTPLLESYRKPLKNILTKLELV